MKFLDRIDKNFIQGLIALAFVWGCGIYPTMMGLGMNPAMAGFLGTIIGFYFGKR